MPSRLRDALQSGEFVVTCELSPPKGTDLSPLLTKATTLSRAATAFNLTDSAAARMTMAPVAAGYALLQHGLEPIVQITSRDKNRLALQGDMLGAAALGINNIVVMGGDPPNIGDHKEARGVYDLFSSQLIAAAQALNNGRDYAGNALRGNTEFFIGGVCNPGAANMDKEIENTRRKIDAGAQFFQTQAIYRAAELEKFLDKLNAPAIAILGGIIPIKSVMMANYMNERVPGIAIPDGLIARIAAAEKSNDVVTTSLAIAMETIAEIRSLCRGIHVMAIGWEEHAARLLADLQTQSA